VLRAGKPVVIDLDHEVRPPASSQSRYGRTSTLAGETFLERAVTGFFLQEAYRGRFENVQDVSLNREWYPEPTK
ncbi:MAG: hypothetical protein ACKO8Z_05370, partial [Prosthecobacter sp.]